MKSKCFPDLGVFIIHRLLFGAVSINLGSKEAMCQFEQQGQVEVILKFISSKWDGRV